MGTSGNASRDCAPQSLIPALGRGRQLSIQDPDEIGAAPPRAKNDGISQRRH